MEIEKNTLRHSAKTFNLKKQKGKHTKKIKQNVRAFCRVFTGSVEHGEKYLKTAMERYSPAKKKNNSESYIVIDDATTAILKRPMDESPAKCLYGMLQDYGVTFLHTSDIHQFLSEGNQTDYFHETISLIKKLTFKTSINAEYHHAMADAYKLLCLSYAFSKNARLDAAAVIDIDSLAPLFPPTLHKSGTGIPAPFSFRMAMTIIGHKETITLNHLMDAKFLIEFFRILTKYRELPKSIKNMSLVSLILNYSFNEIRTKEAAITLQKEIQKQFLDILNSKKWNIHKLDDIKSDFNTTLKELAKLPDLSLYGVTYTPCHYTPEQKVDIYCRLSANSPSDIEYNILLSAIHTTLLRTQLTYILPALTEKKTTFFSNHKHIFSLTPDFMKDIKSVKECHQLGKSESNSACLAVHQTFGMLVPLQGAEELSPLITNPLNDWGVEATVAQYKWDVRRQMTEPKIVPALGEYHAFALCEKGNLTAITSLNDKKNQIPWLFAKTTTRYEEGVNGLQSGITAGVLDEFCSRTQITDFSLIYKTVRGYLLAQGSGCALGLLNHIYDRYMEPFLPDGRLKSFCSHILPRSFLLASIAQGNLPGTICALVGYEVTRGVAQALFPYRRKNRRARNEGTFLKYQTMM